MKFASVRNPREEIKKRRAFLERIVAEKEARYAPSMNSMNWGLKMRFRSIKATTAKAAKAMLLSLFGGRRAKTMRIAPIKRA
jgi:recombinational DNA repair ATPase RecF